MENFRASVSINKDGTIVKVYQPFILNNEIHYNVGQLNGGEINSEDTKFLDYGRYPKVAINNGNRIVEVHEGSVYQKYTIMLERLMCRIIVSPGIIMRICFVGCSSSAWR